MINRHYITEGLYSTFSQKIILNNFDDFPVFLHEIYHHIQNNSTIIGAERLNLVVQFLGQMSIISKNAKKIHFPLSKTFENKELFEGLSHNEKVAIENIILQLDEWLYLEKSNYTPEKVHSEHKKGSLIQIDETTKDSFTPFMIIPDENRMRAYPVGGFTISESGAFALQLFHTEDIDEKILDNINDYNYQYLLILYYIHDIICDFRLACLATFLLCDLSMLVSTPSIGFYALYQTLRLTLKKGMTQEEILKWYEWQFYVWKDEINFNIKEEKKMIKEIKKSKNKFKLNKHIDYLLNWLMLGLEKGLEIRSKKPLEFVSRLLSAKNEDIAYLIKEYPITVIEDKSTGNLHYSLEEHILVLELMDAVTELFFGLVMNFDHITQNKEIMHLKYLAPNSYLFDIQIDKNTNDSDAYGYMIHLLGLNDKVINVIK